ncbi:44903_t:CDS:2 [Gigaspora margarita]|uniref:44903_t:CDS:1 n=1 Tax=Gigaspora margarita TaxID=4874 RepID=A0ABN7UDJ5_GIGMA|nr:44903_t:CDS:2 [Gigaspora margarita]
MSVRHLSDDLIHDILQYLREDRDALYYSLCVNRFWSSQVVPLLWCQPFVNCPLSKRHLLIRTYISCFNTDELKNLNPYKINNLFEIQPTLFDYARYLESISDCHLNSSVLDWIHKQINQKFSDFPVGAITASLWHLFLRKCVKIHSILISPHYFNSLIPTLKSTLLTSTALHSLRNLEIVIDLGTPSNLTTSIIAKAGHMLQLLVMDCVNNDMIDFVSKYCPNISMLYVELTQNDYTLLFPWIGSLQLETLEVKCSVESRNRTHLLSANDKGMEILPEDFNNFSKNCNVPLQTFIIQGILKHYNDDEVLCLIYQFATLHNNTLELFGIDRDVIPQKWSKKLKKLGIDVFSIDDFETLYKSY